MAAHTYRDSSRSSGTAPAALKRDVGNGVHQVEVLFSTWRDMRYPLMSGYQEICRPWGRNMRWYGVVCMQVMV